MDEIIETCELNNIENEFSYIKEYFRNVKFAYKERKSKLYFYQNLINKNIDFIAFNTIKTAKEDLKNTKNTFKELNDSIKSLSNEIYFQNIEIKNLSKEYMELTKTLEKITVKNQNMETIKFNLSNQNTILKQYNDIKLKNNLLYNNILQIKKKMQFNELNELMIKQQSIENEKISLSKKIRRLTLVNTTNDIEDIFYWQKMISTIYKTIFGEIKYKIIDNKYKITIFYKIELNLTICNKTLIDIDITDYNEAEIKNFTILKEWCIKINDPRLILIYTYIYFKNIPLSIKLKQNINR